DQVFVYTAPPSETRRPPVEKNCPRMGEGLFGQGHGGGERGETELRRRRRRRGRVGGEVSREN
ncbi:hypothetical protein Csa_023646, partial [Cucumis sativus]